MGSRPIGRRRGDGRGRGLPGPNGARRSRRSRTGRRGHWPVRCGGTGRPCGRDVLRVRGRPSPSAWLGRERGADWSGEPAQGPRPFVTDGGLGPLRLARGWPRRLSCPRATEPGCHTGRPWGRASARGGWVFAMPAQGISQSEGGPRLRFKELSSVKPFSPQGAPDMDGSLWSRALCDRPAVQRPGAWGSGLPGPPPRRPGLHPSRVVSGWGGVAEVPLLISMRLRVRERG